MNAKNATNIFGVHIIEDGNGERTTTYTHDAVGKEPLLKLKNGYLDFKNLVTNRDWDNVFFIKNSSIYAITYDGNYVRKITLSQHFNMIDNMDTPSIYIDDKFIPVIFLYEIPKFYFCASDMDIDESSFSIDFAVSKKKQADMFNISRLQYHTTSDKKCAKYTYFINSDVLDYHKYDNTKIERIVERISDEKGGTCTFHSPTNKISKESFGRFCNDMVGLLTCDSNVYKFSSRCRFSDSVASYCKSKSNS